MPDALGILLSSLVRACSMASPPMHQFVPHDIDLGVVCIHRCGKDSRFAFAAWYRNCWFTRRRFDCGNQHSAMSEKGINLTSLRLS